MQPRHFLSLTDLSAEELTALLDRADELKRLRRQGIAHATLPGKVLAIVFEKSSTRTRVSFEAAMAHLGGSAMFLSPRDTQLGRGEPVEDTARVISSMVDVITVRTFEHEKLERFAQYSSVPVINSLTDRFHPCQLLADMQTFREHRGELAGRRVTWVGDGNNMCNSWLKAARLVGFELRVACPSGFEPEAALVDAAAALVTEDPAEAVSGADLVVTDVWASMGQEEEQAQRRARFARFQVNDALLTHAADDCIVMHCLPAHRGEEITADVLEGPRSVVWDEAENRMHAQKALLEFLVKASSAA